MFALLPGPFVLSVWSAWRNNWPICARREFEEAFKRDNQPSFHYGRGLLRSELGDFPGAAEDFGAVIEAVPSASTIPTVFYRRGIARYANGDLAGALGDFDEALTKMPDSTDTLGARAITRIRLDQFEPAEEDETRLTAVAPNGPDALGVRGALQLARGDGGAAVVTLTAAANGDSAWSRWLGLAHLRAGRVDEARRTFTELIAGASAGDLLIAMSEVEWQARAWQREEQVSAETRAAAELIGTELRGAVEAARQGATPNEQ